MLESRGVKRKTGKLDQALQWSFKAHEMILQSIKMKLLF